MIGQGIEQEEIVGVKRSCFTRLFIDHRHDAEHLFLEF